MQKCPYCAESIQDDAIKCRYCNEWIDKSKSNHLFEFVSNTRKFISDELNKIKQGNEESLFFPTISEPVQIRNVLFYSDRLSTKGDIRYFNKIVIIYCDVKVKTKNFVTNRELDFKLGFKNEELKGKEGYFELIPVATNDGRSLFGSGLNKKEFEQMNLLHNVIAAASFDSRVSFYTDDLKQKGYFRYGDYEFRENGDITKKDKFIANLSEEVRKRTIHFGAEWQGFKWSEENPFEFFITSGSTVRIKFLGMESGLKLKTDTYINHDVFKSLIEYFVLNDRFPVI